MTEVHAFFDRDVLIKLGCCDLWSETQAAFQITHPYRLASATRDSANRILARRGIVGPLLTQAVSRVEQISKTVPIVPTPWVTAAVSGRLYNQLNECPDIDAGEAQLAAIALSCGVENRLVTGDKRFVNAFSNTFPDEMQKLTGKLLSFEQCLLSCVTHNGFDYVRSKTLPYTLCDTTLRIALGSNGDNTADDFVAALKAYCPIQN